MRATYVSSNAHAIPSSETPLDLTTRALSAVSRSTTCIARYAVISPTAVMPQQNIAREDRAVDKPPRSVGLRVAIWGATGAAGREVLRQCLANPRIGEIVTFTRRPLECDEHERTRLEQVLVDDFLDLAPYGDALRNLDLVFWCLGVSQLTEPDPQAYRVITRDFAVAAAQAIKDHSPNAVFHFLSGLGAAKNGLSPVMWGRAKGEAEKALGEVGLRRLMVWRPTFIHSVAGRENPTRGDRMAELLYFRAIPLLTNSTLDIAQAMLHTSFTDEGDRTYGPWGIIQLAKQYRRSQAEAV
jgi:uncharacterized protein YbjT (DUF2867 family)